jgi:DNA-binding XRE family transcriptional regulator
MEANSSESSSATAEPVSSVLSRMRHMLKMTQAEFATALCVSSKAVQSYEQGWRRVPCDILNQALALLAETRRRTLPATPCWNLVQCPESQKKVCPSFLMGTGQLCWSLAASRCRIHQRTNGEVDTSCPVIRGLFERRAAQ